MMIQIPDAYTKKFVNGIQHPHLYLWDSWSYVENNVIHLYCLAISKLKPNGEKLQPKERNDYPFHIRHFTSADEGTSWNDEGCFLKPQDISKYNFRTIWSGSVEPLQNGNKLIVYTGLEHKDLDHLFIQNIGIGISEDGYIVNHNYDDLLSSPIRDWKAIREKGYYLDPIDKLGSNLGEDNGPITSWRDPFLFHDKDDKLNLFWGAKVSPRSSAIARATLKSHGNSYSIEELHPPITVPDGDEFTQLEVPKIVYDSAKGQYYMVISSCNRLFENQPDSEINKEVRLYTSKHIDGPWTSLGDKILDKENLFGITVLKPDFKNNRLLCMAPYTEQANEDLMLSFVAPFYIYLDSLRVEFLNKNDIKS